MSLKVIQSTVNLANLPFLTRLSGEHDDMMSDTNHPCMPVRFWQVFENFRDIAGRWARWSESGARRLCQPAACRGRRAAVCHSSVGGQPLPLDCVEVGLLRAPVLFPPSRPHAHRPCCPGPAKIQVKHWFAVSVLTSEMCRFFCGPDAFAVQQEV